MLICAIGIAFIIGMFMTAFSCRVKKERKEFIDSLTTEQLRIYENIKSQRWNIFLNASLVGILMGVVAIFIYTQSFTSNPTTAACLFLSIAFIVQYFYYILSPKNNWMITTLNTEQQRKEWRDVYKVYQNTYHLGLLLGLIGYFACGYGLNKLLINYK